MPSPTLLLEFWQIVTRNESCLIYFSSLRQITVREFSYSRLFVIGCCFDGEFVISAKVSTTGHCPNSHPTADHQGVDFVYVCAFFSIYLCVRSMMLCRYVKQWFIR